MRLSKDVLRAEIEKNKIITGYDNLDSQLTANGFDLRLAGLVEIVGGGRLAINKADNRPPVLGNAYILEGYEDRLKDYKSANVISYKLNTQSFLKLNGALRPYFAISCETVNIPSNMMIDISARSSLFRLTQSSLLCTFGEAGYNGYLTFVMVPFLSSEIELGAKFSQITFSELKGEAHYQQQKEASYQGGKLY